MKQTFFSSIYPKAENHKTSLALSITLLYHGNGRMPWYSSACYTIDQVMSTSENHDLERLFREINALTEVAKALTSPLELPELLDAVMKKIVGVLESADVGVVMLWDQPAGLFRPVAAFGYDMESMKAMGLRAGESITGKVFDAGGAMLLSTPEEVAEAMLDMRPANRAVMARSSGSDAHPRCTVAAPITAGDQKYGVLVLETLTDNASPDKKTFSEADLPFVQTLADLIALVIDRARLQTRADAVREARQAERMRSEVLATLSHELRMPLSAIKGYATALQMDDVIWTGQKRSEFLDEIDQECDNMQMMLKDILDSSLIDVDQLNIVRQPLRLPHIASDVAAEAQRRTKLHRMIVDFPPDFPLVEADSRWIKQVFRNIIDNAIKYSPDGGLIVVRGEARPNDVVISTADQGVGISPEDLIPLFEKFFRVHSTANLHIPGTGLGLPIARSIIEAHGGRIWAESKLGEGTTIYFSLPRPPVLADDE